MMDRVFNIVCCVHLGKYRMRTEDFFLHFQREKKSIYLIMQPSVGEEMMQKGRGETQKKPPARTTKYKRKEQQHVKMQSM